MSEDAHGSLAKLLTFSHRRSGKQVRDFHYPKKEISQKQGTQRHIIGLLTAQGQTMTSNQKLVYINEAKAKHLNMTGFNYFIKVAQKDLYTHSNLVAYGSFNELSGATVYDYSGNAHHATLKPTYPSNCPRRDDSFKKSYGKALHFDGNDYIQTPSFAIPNTGVLTVEVWTKQQINATTHQTIFGEPPNSGTIGFVDIIRLSSVNYLRYYYADGSSANSTNFTDFFLNLDNQWIHIVTVCDYTNKTLKAYRNGVQFGATKNLSGTPVFPSTNRVKYIGSYSTSINKLTDGSLDEVRIYNRGLSADEIGKHYNMLRFDKDRQPGGHPIKK